MHNAYRAAGLFSVALLGLTACGFADEQTPEDSAPEETAPEETAPEETAPEETAEDGAAQDGASQESTDSEEASGDSAAQAPQLAEIEEEVWDASASQDSVNISGEMAAALFGWDSLSAEEDPDEQAEAAENVEVTIAGDSAGDGSIYQVGDVFDYVIFGDDIYQSVDSVVAEYELSQPPEGTEAPTTAEVRQAFEAEGSWANVGPAGRDYVETPADFVTNFHEGFLATSGLDSLSDAGLEGASDTRDGQDVWVYRTDQGEDFIELVVNADESQPLLRKLSYDMGGNEFDVDFSDWNEAEAPQEPAAEEVIEPDEVRVILDSLG
ncbi:hypothetical protein GCM10023354_16340 [Garicola koreensis]|uniref:hypothetical protein n=1 Tax=Garicola koreensis TaxID=1262554 RepID=UPI0031EB5562